MKHSASLLLKAIKPIQRQPVPIRDLARRAAMSQRSAVSYLHLLEKARFLAVDRSERPHAYEITAAGYTALQFEEYREQQFSFRLCRLD